MILLGLQHRIIESKDWAFMMFLLALLLVVFIKSTFEKRFFDFSRIIVSDKYHRIYKDSSNILSLFTLFIFIVNIISLAFFIQLVAVKYELAVKSDWVLFIRIATLLTVFILVKYLIEKIVATIFGIEEIMDEYNLTKVNYRTYVGLLLLPITVVMFYNDGFSNILIVPLFFLLIAINLFTYVITFVRYQNYVLSKLFYFILYLCAFEIAPYYFVYYLIKKN
jgi:Domain of unknown function (DUF4271)